MRLNNDFYWPQLIFFLYMISYIYSMIDKFYFHSHESTGIHIPEIHLLSFSKNVNGIKQLCKCYHGNHVRP